MRETLIDSAFAVCEKHGVAGLTLRRIAAAAGVTAPAIYRHFPGKAQVLKAMVDRANARFGVYLARADQEATSWGRVEGTLRAFINFALDDPWAADVLFFTRHRSDDELQPEQRNSTNFRTLLSRIEDAKRDGALRSDLDPLTVALTLWAHAQGLLSLHLQGRFGGSATRLRELFNEGFALLAHGIRPNTQGRVAND